jgi:hypothetical protein
MDGSPIPVQVARLEERVESLEEHRQRQNGSLQRLEDKVEDIWKMLTLTLLGVLGSIIATLFAK